MRGLYPQIKYGMQSLAYHYTGLLHHSMVLYMAK